MLWNQMSGIICRQTICTWASLKINELNKIGNQEHLVGPKIASQISSNNQYLKTRGLRNMRHVRKGREIRAYGSPLLTFFRPINGSYLVIYMYRAFIKYTHISNSFPGYTNEDIDMRSFATSRGDRDILFGI